MTWLWTLPTPHTLLAIGLHCILFIHVTNCESWRSLFQISTLDLWDNFFFVRGQSEASSALNNHKNPSYFVKSQTTNSSLISSQHVIFLLFIYSDKYKCAIKNEHGAHKVHIPYIPRVKWRNMRLLWILPTKVDEANVRAWTLTASWNHPSNEFKHFSKCKSPPKNLKSLRSKLRKVLI